ncbi:MAG: hypothetical protein LC808_43430, partial [Actinobacteria bacterium]|nr:hypothetical protein [Actinomycetota bacterium]
SPAGWRPMLGFVTEPTSAEVRGTAADAARQARGVLAALADPDDELTATAAMRHRLEGTAVALETVAGYADAGAGAGSVTPGCGRSSVGGQAAAAPRPGCTDRSP